MHWRYYYSINYTVLLIGVRRIATQAVSLHLLVQSASLLQIPIEHTLHANFSVKDIMRLEVLHICVAILYYYNSTFGPYTYTTF